MRGKMPGIDLAISVACSRRPGQQRVVSTGSGNLHRSFDVFLPHNVGEIGRIDHLAVIDRGLLLISGNRPQAGQMADQLR